MAAVQALHLPFGDQFRGLQGKDPLTTVLPMRAMVMTATTTASLRILLARIRMVLLLPTRRCCGSMIDRIVTTATATDPITFAVSMSITAIMIITVAILSCK